MREVTFSKHTERPKCFRYGDHPRIRRKTEKIVKEQENNEMKTCLQQLTMLGKPQKG